MKELPGVAKTAAGRPAEGALAVPRRQGGGTAPCRGLESRRSIGPYSSRDEGGDPQQAGELQQHRLAEEVGRRPGQRGGERQA